MFYPIPTTWSSTDKGSGVILSNGNLTAACPMSNGLVRSAHPITSGKYYWEVKLENIGVAGFVGVATNLASYNSLGGDFYGWSYYCGDGTKFNNGSYTAYGATPALNDIIGVALDMDVGTVEFFKNGVSQGVAFTGLAGFMYAAVGGASNGVSSTLTANFGSTAFTYSPPSGYYAGLGPLQAVTTGTADLTMPMLAAVGYGAPHADITLPALLAIGYAQGAGAVAIPMLLARASGHDSTGENASSIDLPMLTLVAQGGGNGAMTLPSMTSVALATGTNLGDASGITCPMVTVLASGTVSATGSADLTIGTLTSVTFSLVGYSGAVCSVTLNDGLTVVATGMSGVVASAAITLPLFELAASGTAQNSGGADLIMPALRPVGPSQAWVTLPGVTLVATGRATVTATYEAYAVNLKHQPKPGKEPNDEVTRYTNFPFTHIVRYKNSYFGANSTGLYLLDGTTDYATPTPTAIPWAFKTAMTDFKSQQHKTVASAYFGGRLGAAATIDLHVGEDGPQTYSYATVRTDHAQNYRQVFGKGTKARYYALGASGTGTLELDDIDLDVHTLSRRI